MDCILSLLLLLFCAASTHVGILLARTPEKRSVRDFLPATLVLSALTLVLVLGESVWTNDRPGLGTVFLLACAFAVLACSGYVYEKHLRHIPDP